MPQTPERFLWAVGKISARPTDDILEIGCGNGLLIDQLSTKITTGTIVGIDKSISAISQATKRNKKAIQEGKVMLKHYEMAKAKFDDASFDKIVAFNVNIFLKDLKGEATIIRRILKPRGKLFVFYQYPYQINISAADPIISMLEENSFQIIETEMKKLTPTNAICIVATGKS